MNEFDNESLYSPETEAQKTHSIQAVEQGSSSSGWSQDHTKKLMGNVVYRSIKTVVFSNKLNLLMPFGPLAILVYKLTGHRVSFNYTCFVLLLQIALLCTSAHFVLDCRVGYSFLACWA